MCGPKLHGLNVLIDIDLGFVCEPILSWFSDAGHNRLVLVLASKLTWVVWVVEIDLISVCATIITGPDTGAKRGPRLGFTPPSTFVRHS